MLSFCGHSEQKTHIIFFHALISKTIEFKTAERRKNIRIRKFEHDIFWIPFTVTSSEKIRKFELHYKKSSREPNNLFDLNDFSNYGSSNYRSFLIGVY